MIEAWDFLRKYVSESDRLDWGTEAACRATMRDIQFAAKDCGIAETISTADGWETLVTLMNMPDKNQ